MVTWKNVLDSGLSRLRPRGSPGSNYRQCTHEAGEKDSQTDGLDTSLSGPGLTQSDKPTAGISQVGLTCVAVP